MEINRVSTLKHKYLQIAKCIADIHETLYYLGNLPTERRTSVAIVGSRKPTAYGKEVTYRLAYELAQRGVVIISGLALGVDAIAHKAALDAGGTTIAVLANGLDRIYPATNQSLAEQIIKQSGAIISEYPEGTEARGYQFLARNRIVSGLSDAIIITEAAGRSGTLNTAAHALDQGKDIYAVPGNITSPLSAGCNGLIQQGATPVTSIDDIVETLSPAATDHKSALFDTSSPEQAQLISLIKQGVRSLDGLQEGSRLPAPELAQTLTLLEISGAIRQVAPGVWSL